MKIKRNDGEEIHQALSCSEANSLLLFFLSIYAAATTYFFGALLRQFECYPKASEFHQRVNVHVIGSSHELVDHIDFQFIDKIAIPFLFHTLWDWQGDARVGVRSWRRLCCVLLIHAVAVVVVCVAVLYIPRQKCFLSAA